MSKHKVMRVITTCSDCDHRRDLVEIGGNTYYSSVCAFNEASEDNTTEAFMLYFSYDHPKHYKLVIPDNCPLEDYKSIKPEVPVRDEGPGY